MIRRRNFMAIFPTVFTVGYWLKNKTITNNQLNNPVGMCYINYAIDTNTEFATYVYTDNDGSENITIVPMYKYKKVLFDEIENFTNQMIKTAPKCKQIHIIHDSINKKCGIITCSTLGSIVIKPKTIKD